VSTGARNWRDWATNLCRAVAFGQVSAEGVEEALREAYRAGKMDGEASEALRNTMASEAGAGDRDGAHASLRTALLEWRDRPEHETTDELVSLLLDLIDGSR
jgi:hypothetical protein